MLFSTGWFLPWAERWRSAARYFPQLVCHSHQSLPEKSLDFAATVQIYHLPVPGALILHISLARVLPPSLLLSSISDRSTIRVILVVYLPLLSAKSWFLQFEAPVATRHFSQLLCLSAHRRAAVISGQVLVCFCGSVHQTCFGIKLRFVQSSAAFLPLAQAGRLSRFDFPLSI